MKVLAVLAVSIPVASLTFELAVSSVSLTYEYKKMSQEPSFTFYFSKNLVTDNHYRQTGGQPTKMLLTVVVKSYSIRQNLAATSIQLVPLNFLMLLHTDTLMTKIPILSQ